MTNSEPAPTSGSKRERPINTSEESAFRDQKEGGKEDNKAGSLEAFCLHLEMNTAVWTNRVPWIGTNAVKRTANTEESFMFFMGWELARFGQAAMNPKPSKKFGSTNPIKTRGRKAAEKNWSGVEAGEWPVKDPVYPNVVLRLQPISGANLELISQPPQSILGPDPAKLRLATDEAHRRSRNIKMKASLHAPKKALQFLSALGGEGCVTHVTPVWPPPLLLPDCQLHKSHFFKGRGQQGVGGGEERKGEQGDHSPRWEKQTSVGGTTGWKGQLHASWAGLGWAGLGWGNAQPPVASAKEIIALPRCHLLPFLMTFHVWMVIFLCVMPEVPQPEPAAENLDRPFWSSLMWDGFLRKAGSHRVIEASWRPGGRLTPGASASPQVLQGEEGNFPYFGLFPHTSSPRQQKALCVCVSVCVRVRECVCVFVYPGDGGRGEALLLATCPFNVRESRGDDASLAADSLVRLLFPWSRAGQGRRGWGGSLPMEAKTGLHRSSNQSPKHPAKNSPIGQRAEIEVWRKLCFSLSLS
ncbi:hypothetical protein L345_00274, partial [Ophiophagus hannah]